MWSHLVFVNIKPATIVFPLKKNLVIYASECWTIAIKLESFLGCILLCIKNNSDLRFLWPVKINVKAADPPPCPSLSNTQQEQNSVFPSVLHIFHPKDRLFFQIRSGYGHSRGEPSAQPKALSTSDKCNKDRPGSVPYCRISTVQVLFFKHGESHMYREFRGHGICQYICCDQQKS